MSAELLAAVGVTREVWKHLPAEKKRKIRELYYDRNQHGMAKIVASHAKKAAKKARKTVKSTVALCAATVLTT
jgi:hypothetical protein